MVTYGTARLSRSNEDLARNECKIGGDPNKAIAYAMLALADALTDHSEVVKEAAKDIAFALEAPR